MNAAEHVAQADSDTQGPPPAVGSIDDVRAVALLTAEKRELESRIDIIETRLKAAHAGALLWFENNAIQSTTVEGYTVFLKRELWAKIIDPDAAMAALKAVGWDDYVQPKISTQSLSARLRELDKDGVPLPLEFDGAIGVSEVYKINARKK